MLHSFLLAARFLCLSGLSAGCDGLFVQCLSVFIDGRAIGRVAHVVPHRRAVGAGGGSVDVVTEELGSQVVLARTPSVAGFTPVDLREAVRVGTFGVQHHTHKLSVVVWSLGTFPERRGEGVVHEPRIRPVWRDGRSRVVAAVVVKLIVVSLVDVSLLDRLGILPVVPTGARRRKHDVLMVQYL